MTHCGMDGKGVEDSKTYLIGLCCKGLSELGPPG